MKSSFRKLMICPYFGPFPEWMNKYEKPEGYDIIIDTDVEGFKKRVKDKLGIDYPGLPGTGKVWDYRCALGYLYQEELEIYDFWGHTDFDCVYGDVNKWVTDDFLNSLDIHSNDTAYINGPWTLYRNNPKVNQLFKTVENWQEYIKHKEPNGWVEGVFSRAVENSGLRVKYTAWEGNPRTTKPNLIKDKEGRLFQDGTEIMMFHFRHSKVWPLK